MPLETVHEGSVIHPLAAKSVFWELKTTVSDPAFEKEAWISAALILFGECGFSIADKATIFFCSRDLAPGVAKMPTAPLSEDAVFLSSIFINPECALRGLDTVLVDAAIMNLSSRNFPAVEAFGYRDHNEARALLGSKPAFIGLPPVESLESAGFSVIRDHPITPRLRLELPPKFDLLTAAAAEDLLAQALA